MAEYIPKSGNDEFIQSSFRATIIEHAEKIINGEADMPNEKTEDEQVPSEIEDGEPEPDDDTMRGADDDESNETDER